MALAQIFMSTVHGAMHIDKGMPREDAGGKFAGENFKVFVTADGHGSHECVRSAQGAQFAVDIATAKLSSFAKTVEEMSITAELFSNKTQEIRIRKLITSIEITWQAAIQDDVSANPFTEEEYASAGSVSDYYRKGMALEHAYGTTLLAGLLTEDYLLLIHQGDGRIVAFDENGRAYEPVPWDDRCEGNFTTSLSDDDAIPSTRYVVLPMKEKKILAAFLCSDGVEDSFNRMESTYGFCRKLLGICCKEGVDEMESHLPGILDDLSKNGSRDDITVSGYVYTDEIAKFLDSFNQEDEQISLEVQLQKVSDKLLSMSRKREYLKQEVEKAKQTTLKVNLTIEQKQNQVEQCQNQILGFLKNKEAMEQEVEKLKLAEIAAKKKEEEATDEYIEYENRYQEFAKQQFELESRINAIKASLGDNVNSTEDVSEMKDVAAGEEATDGKTVISENFEETQEVEQSSKEVTEENSSDNDGE